MDVSSHEDSQTIPGNDQNASPTNQEIAGSKMFHALGGISFLGDFLVRICLLGCLLRYLVKSLVFNGKIFE